MARYVLALDLGTSSAHCLLVNQEGQPLGGADAPVRHYTPPGGPPLAREFHPHEVMTTLGGIVPQALHQAQASGREVVAVGITGQRQGLALLDRAGKELYAGPNIDLRAVFEGALLDQALGAEIYRVTGHSPSLLLAPARLKWFRAHQPDLLDRASTLLSIPGWLGYRLTGQASSEPGLDCELGLVDLSTRLHATEFLEKLGVPARLIPPLTCPGQALAGLRPEVAESWGLLPHTPVTLAGADSHCGLLGLGLAAPMQVGAVLGWSGSLHMLTPGPRLDLEGQRTWAGCYPTGGLYTAEANLGDAGNAYSWLVRTVGGGRLSYGDAEGLAQQAPPGSDGASVFLGPGPLSAPQAGLRLGGVMFPTPLTFQTPTPGQLFRSYLESIAYSVKANLEVLARVSGQSASCLALGGGLASSNILAATLADALGMPVQRSPQPRVSALGAAAAAWVLAGMFNSLEEAALAWRRDFDVFLPEPTRSAEHQDYYRRWLELYHRLSPPL